jgi:3-deoxy-D-manno-octulosonic-acid transferase
MMQPRAFILVEAELWPNHLDYCANRGIPIILINARISDRSMPRYQKLPMLFGKTFRAFRCVTLQNEADVQRLLRLGFSKDALKVVGSLKYDVSAHHDEAIRNRLAKEVSGLNDKILWIAGSTHPGEEEMILKIFKAIKRDHPRVTLVLAPRHVERCVEVEELIRRHGYDPIRRSRISDHAFSENTVLLIDTTGELKYLYEYGSLIFVGKSLLGHGGQNIIEPASWGKAVMFGPHMENFAMIAEDFLRHRAAIQVQGEEDLEQWVKRLLSSEVERKEWGGRAQKWIETQKGGLDRALFEVSKLLS